MLKNIVYDITNNEYHINSKLLAVLKRGDVLVNVSGENYKDFDGRAVEFPFKVGVQYTSSNCRIGGFDRVATSNSKFIKIPENGIFKFQFSCLCNIAVIPDILKAIDSIEVDGKYFSNYLKTNRNILK